jgi:hypothetical protein
VVKIADYEKPKRWTQSAELERRGSNSEFGLGASQASNVGSIPIARSINPVDAVGFTGFPPQKPPLNSPILDAVGREIPREIRFWTRRGTSAVGYCEQVFRLPDITGAYGKPCSGIHRKTHQCLSVKL